MTTKNVPPKRGETVPEASDELRAAYQAHTLAHMLYSYMAPYHGWMLQPPYAAQGFVPRPHTPEMTLGTTESMAMLPGGAPPEPLFQAPQAPLLQAAWPPWGVPFPYWRP